MTNDAPMSREKLDEILKDHAKWVESDGEPGKRADLRHAKLQGASAVVPAFLLLFYNLIRAGLTWVVGPMRDDEEATGVSPAYEAYKRLVPLHWAFTVLFWFAIATVVNAARVYLALPVSIPAP